MGDLYAGTATFSMPNGPTVKAEVNLWTEEHGPLVEWAARPKPASRASCGTVASSRSIALSAPKFRTTASHPG